MLRLARWLLPLALLGTGCDEAPGLAERAEAALQSGAGLSVLDRSSDGRQLLGELARAARPSSGEGALYRLTRVEADGAEKKLAIPPARHGLLGPGGQLAVVDGEEGLWWQRGQRAPVRLDQHVDLAVAFSADGNRLAYARRTPASLKTGVFEGELWIAELDGPTPRTVRVPPGAPAPSGLHSPAFAEDGRTLFAVGSDARTGLLQIVAIDPSTGARRPVSNVELPAPRDGRAPEGFVPLPLGPRPMEHRQGTLRYFSGHADVELELATGRARLTASRGGAR